MRTINIDGVPREIRFYGDTAVVMLAWDDPREIGFQGGSRRVIFDDRETVLCSFNDTYRECIIDGTTHRLVLGIYICIYISLHKYVLFYVLAVHSIKQSLACSI